MANNTRNKLLNDKLDYLYSTKRIFRDVLEEQGVEISDEDTFREYADKIRTLNNGDVLLFETEQEMREYENPKEGILAVIYQSYTGNMGSEYIRYIIFPERVTLTEECTSNYSMSLRNQKGNYVGNMYLTPESFYFYISDVAYFEINYTSTDGINYIRETEITNPIDLINPVLVEYYSYSQLQYFKQFIKYESGYFGGLYKCIDGIFVSVINQFSLTSPNQILTGYTAYGSTGPITGDGTYITNMRTNEYVNKYLPNINNNTFTAGIIQYGTQVKPMEYVQRRQIKSDDAFDTQFPSADCVVQLADTRDVTIENTSANKTIIQNYLNATEKYNYAFFIGDVAYRLYLGYNYNTKEQMNAATGNYQTVPYQMTSLYAFIVNLEDLSIYRTFTNTDTWSFVNNGSGGNMLTYAYSIKSDCLVILSDLDGWANSGGAYIGLTIITPSGNRTTNYYSINYSADYSFKKIDCTSYDNDQDCYYLAYFSANQSWSSTSTKRICKLTPSGTLTSIYESSENMQYISSLWTNYFKNVDSLICYTTANKGTVLRNLATGNEITLYGSTISSSSYWGLDSENIYFSHKTSSSDTYYNIYRINRKTLNAELIPETQSTSRISNAFYTYNRELCVFMNNQIISLNGEMLAKFMKAMLNNPSISGIDKINDYMYKASFADYNLQISADRFTAKLPTYTYFDYSNITSFPIINDLCMITPNKTSTVRNDDSGYYKYQSLVITDVARSNEELYARIEELENQLSEANGLADVIRGE